MKTSVWVTHVIMVVIAKMVLVGTGVSVVTDMVVSTATTVSFHGSFAGSHVLWGHHTVLTDCWSRFYGGRKVNHLQILCSVTGCEEPGDVVFAVDSSGSIGKENFQLLVDFTKAVVMELPIDGDTQIGLETICWWGKGSDLSYWQHAISCLVISVIRE